MPAKNTVRAYSKDSYFHIYNRGVEKRIIFIDNQDYHMFHYYLFVYLAPPQIVQAKYPKLRANLKRRNLFGKFDLLAYCLMPNHFHLLVKQIDQQATTAFMRQLTNAYTQYFNKKYDRVGSLFQGVFKAATVESEEYLLHLSRYIHLNPIKLLPGLGLPKLESYPWSSYPIYLGRKKSSYVQPAFVLDFFLQNNDNSTYKTFVETLSAGEGETLTRQGLTLENEDE